MTHYLFTYKSPCFQQIITARFYLLRRVSRFAVPTELPVEEYVEPRFKAGCRLSDGNVVMEGDSLLDKGNCRVSQ